MNEELNKVYELMGKLNENFPTFPHKESGDVIRYQKDLAKSKIIDKDSKKIDKPIEFESTFKTWFEDLGYVPNGDLTIIKVLNSVKKVLQELGYK